MEDKKTNDNSVAGSSGHIGGTKRGKRWLLYGGLTLLVIVGAAGAGFGVYKLQQARHDRDENVHPGEVRFSEEVTSAQDLLREGNYDKAHETISDTLKDTGLSAQEKHDLCMQQGVTYENQRNYDAAMESFRQAEAAKESVQAAQSIANLAVKKDDKPLAITYYKKAITLIPADPPQVYDNTKQYFENMIIFLEGGQPSEQTE